MKTITYTDDDAAEWDTFLESSFNGTFLHSRRFLSYHCSRFEDASLRILDAKSRLVGVLPAAVNPLNPMEVISHPGITYGGLIHGIRLHGTGILNSFEAILETYRGAGFQSFLYKAIPKVYQVIPSEDDVYAMFRLSAERTRCDLSTAIDLDQRQDPTERRKRALRRAGKNGIVIRTGFKELEMFWSVLTENLFRRHHLLPVHAVEEMLELRSRFPGQITLVTGFLNAQLVAGTIVFRSRRTDHTQYLAASDPGRETGALDFVIEHCISRAAQDGQRYFNFGVSTENDGQFLNDGLHAFKTEFGGGGIVHEFYRIKL